MACALADHAADVAHRHASAIDGPAEAHECWVFASAIATEITDSDVAAPFLWINAEGALGIMEREGGFARCYAKHMKRLGYARVTAEDASLGAFGIVRGLKTVAVKVDPDWWLARTDTGTAWLPNTSIMGARCASN